MSTNMLENSFSQWYQNTSHELTNQGTWLRGGEFNTLPSDEYYKRPYRVLLVRLSTCRDTSVSFTHTMLYKTLTDNPSIFVDMAYLPPPNDTQIFTRDNVPYLLGTSTKLGASHFDMIAISNSVLLETMNVPGLLQNSGIPLRKEDRIGDSSIPLIILGGANALWTSLFVNAYSPIDGIFAGEELSTINSIFSHCVKAKEAKTTKRELLDILDTQIEGFFQPDKPHQVKKVQSSDLDIKLLTDKTPVPFEEGCAGTGHLQISEGCACFCSFCAESWSRKPYREFDTANLVKAAETMKSSLGLEDIEVYSFNFSMHKEFYPLLWELSSRFPSVGLKSQRIDYIAEDPDILKYLHAVGKSSLTFGIEGISDRLRKYLHKGIDKEQLNKGLRQIIRTPLREIKFFLIATGLEAEDDYTELKALLKSISLETQRVGRKPRIIFSVTPLVRFPFTPLEDQDAPALPVINKILQQIERIVNGHGFEYRKSATIYDYFLSQVIVRANDPRVYEALVKSIESTKFFYYEEVSEEFFNTFVQNLKEKGLDPDLLLMGSKEEQKNWSFLNLGLSETFISESEERVENFVDNGYCAGTFNESGDCKSCGACEDDHVRDRINAPRGYRSYSPDDLKSLIKKQNSDCTTIKIRVNIGEHLRGISRKYAGSILASALMSTDQSITPYYWGFLNARIAEPLTDWVYGDEVISLRFRSEGAKKVEEILANPEFLNKINTTLTSWLQVVGLYVENDSDQIELTFESPYNFDPSVFMRENKLKGMSRKVDNVYKYEFTPDTLKKKILMSMSYSLSDGKITLKIIPGNKFVMQDFTTSVFKMPSKDHWSTIKVFAVVG